jgi:hypothetical protein
MSDGGVKHMSRVIVTYRDSFFLFFAVLIFISLPHTAHAAHPPSTRNAPRTADSLEIDSSPGNSPDTLGHFSMGHIHLTVRGDSASPHTEPSTHLLPPFVGADIEFNRVDGWAVKLFQNNHPQDDKQPSIRASEIYAFGRKRILGSLTVSQPLAPRLAARAEAYRVTGTHDGLILRHDENEIAAVLLSRDYYDYFDLEGGRLALHVDAPDRLTVTAGYAVEMYRSLSRRVERGLFTVPHPFRPNPRVDEGLAKSVYLVLDRDTRVSDGDMLPASWEHAEIEIAGGSLGGDFTYTRALAELGVNSPLSPRMNVAYRVMGGVGSQSLPFQQQFFVGGPGTLKAFPLKKNESGGNVLLLANIEYGVELTGAFRLLLFQDVGNAWRDRSTLGRQKILMDLGVGIVSGDLRLYIARDVSSRHGTTIGFVLAHSPLTAPTSLRILVR